MSLISKLPKLEKKEFYIKGQAVGESRDLRRVLALPKRERPSDTELKKLADYIKGFLGTGVTQCACLTKYKRPCCADLLPTQAWALYEAAQANGLLGPIGVGHGKTLLDLLTAMVIDDCKTAVLLLPPNLKSQLLDVDWHFYGQHWKLPNLAGGGRIYPGRPTLHVVAFSELSGSRATDLLSRLRPDTIIVDEAHSVRNRTAARTKRFLRYFNENPKARLFAWSGTLTSRSLKDYAHLSNLALRDGSPTPIHWPTVEEWAGHLDPNEFRSPPGRLSQFGKEGSEARAGYSERVNATLGVVSSGDATSCQASLVISERRIETPEVIKKHIEDVEKTWCRPDGEELIDAMSVGRCLRELSCGFYYRWRWPRKEPTPVIEAWLKARKEWHKELREKLKGARPHMDSPLLCAKAAIRWYNGYKSHRKEVQRIKNPNWTPHFKPYDEDYEDEYIEEEITVETIEVPPKSANGPLPVWPSLCWQEWERVRDTAKPETEAIWLDEFLVDNCLDWLSEAPGLLWYEFDGLSQRIRQRCRERGIKAVNCGPGADGNQAVLGLTGAESAVVSIRAHGTGKNLQQFTRNLVANPPSSGGEWEQLLGRTHRQGQMADEVSVDVFQHTEPFKKALEKARDLSEYIKESFGAPQRLVSKATWKF